MPMNSNIPFQALATVPLQSPLNSMLRVQGLRRSQQEEQLNAMRMDEYRQNRADAPRLAAQQNAQEFLKEAVPMLAKLPPEQRPGAFAQVLAYGQQSGESMDGIPQSYDQISRIVDAAAVPDPMNAYESNRTTETSRHNLEMEKAATLRAQNTGQGGRDYGTFIPTQGGIMYGNNRTGAVGMAPGGEKIIPITGDPLQQELLSRGKSRGKVTGEQQGLDIVKVPAAIEQARQGLNIIDQMVGSEEKGDGPHPGFSSYVGMTLTPGQRLIDGSPAADFDALYKQVTGQAFLDAYETLKGGGQITEIEGIKATAARTRMGKAQSEAEFIKAAREFQQVVRNGIIRAEARLLEARNDSDAPGGGARTVEVDF